MPPLGIELRDRRHCERCLALQSDLASVSINLARSLRMSSRFGVYTRSRSFVLRNSRGGAVVMEDPATGLYAFSVQIALFGVLLATWRHFIPSVYDGQKSYPVWYRNMTRAHGLLDWCFLPLLLTLAVLGFCIGIILLVIDEVTGIHLFAVLFGMFALLFVTLAVLVQRFREGHRTVPTSH